MVSDFFAILFSVSRTSFYQSAQIDLSPKKKRKKKGWCYIQLESEVQMMLEDGGLSVGYLFSCLSFMIKQDFSTL